MKFKRQQIASQEQKPLELVHFNHKSVNIDLLVNKLPYNKNQKPLVLAFLEAIRQQWAIASKCGKLVNGAVHLSRRYIMDVIFKGKLKETAARDLLKKMEANGDFFCAQGRDLGCKNWSGNYNAWIGDSSWYYSLSSIEKNQNRTPIDNTLKGNNIILKIRKLGISFLESKNYLYDKVKELTIPDREQLDFDQKIRYKRLRSDVFEKVRKKKGWDFASTRVFADAFCARHTKDRKSIMIDQYQAFLCWCDKLQQSGFMQTWYYMKSVKIWRPA